jgi:integrase
MDEMKGFKATRRSLGALGSEDRAVRGMWHADRELPGFYVVAYRERLSFFARYRIHGQRRTVKLGDYPATMPEDARKAALAVLGGAARGEDEAEKRAASRRDAETKSKRVTFKTWREEYVKDAARRLKSTRDPERYLAMAGEAWDARPLEEITTRDVETLRNRLADKGSTQANRFLANVRASFSHAVRLGYIEANPAARVPLLRENEPRRRTLSEAEEKRLREVVAVYPFDPSRPESERPKDSIPDPFVRVAFTLLLDTGARLSEVLAAKWEDFHDLDGDTPTWTIPSPKSGKPGSVPLLSETAAVVAATPREDDGPWLVPGRNAFVHRHDLRESWDRLRATAKIGPDVHIHDLRRTAGLRFTRTPGVGIFGASKLLRHSDVRVTERHYAPMNAEDLRGFAEKARVLSFEKRKKAGKGRKK